MLSLRVGTLIGLVAFVLVAAASPATAAPAGGRATTADRQACTASCAPSSAVSSRSSVAPPAAESSNPCVRDAGCGGGGALTQIGAPLMIGVAAGTITFVAGLLRRRFRAHHASVFAGALLANRLFHPPRLVLGS